MTTQHMPEDAGEIKTRRKPSTPRPDPWYKRFPADYKRGTRDLSLAARGAYSDILDMIYMEGGPIRDNDFAIACELRVKQRQWKAARKELFDAGKLVSKNGFISNNRADEELADREITRKGKSSKSPRSVLGDAFRNAERCSTGKLFEGKPNEINVVCTTEAEAEPEADSEGNCGKVENITKVEAVASPPPPVDLVDLSKQLFQAAGEAIASPASFPSLLCMTYPQMWLDQGCDLYKDILPTLRSIGARPHAKKITTWKYFNNPMAEAKAVREAGLPTIHRSGYGTQRQQDASECRKLLDAM